MVGSGTIESEGRKGIEATVGGLVWVRRRNGSWWPGQILGLDELPENGSTTLGSGTPIKLLCRDDTSVEVHDLEKSKGVKAFRCGDYDSCIEKAKASAATSSRRSTKYPRRENAIICALEIERTNLFKNCPSVQKPRNNSDGLLNHVTGSVTMPHPSRDNVSSSEGTSSEETSSTGEDNSNSTLELSHSGVSYEETNGSTYIKGQSFKGRRRKTPNDSEDDGYEGIKRMKGLDDLGIGVDRTVQVLGLPVLQNSVLLNNHRSTNGLSLGSTAIGGSVPTLKRKRSQVVHIHELMKKKYRRRPLTKVLENHTMFPVQIICDEFASPFERSDALPPSYECGNGSKVKDTEASSGQLPGDDSSCTLFDVPFVDEDLHASGLSPTWQSSSPSKPHTVVIRKGSIRKFQAQPSSFGHGTFTKCSPIYPTVDRANQKIGKSASKWQSKGKRKARNLNKTEPYPRMLTGIDCDKSDGNVIGVDEPERFSPTSNGFLDGFIDNRRQIPLVSSPRSFSYHQTRFFVHSDFDMLDVPPRGRFIDSSLYEVEITVEATRPQVQHVPYISLMSKLNGKPITGHPVVVGVLEDGYCDLQISDYPASESCELEDDDIDLSSTVEPKPCRTKIITPKSHRSRKKSSKSKRHAPSLKKTRKLSSLTGPQKVNLEKTKFMVQNTKGPMLACVPLKVVFSRINEALNGSTRSAHHVVTSNNT